MAASKQKAANAKGGAAAKAKAANNANKGKKTKAAPEEVGLFPICYGFLLHYGRW